MKIPGLDYKSNLLIINKEQLILKFNLKVKQKFL